VSCANLARDWAEWLDQIPIDAIGEIHLAGHESDVAGSGLLIDTHGSAVAEPVWALYERFIARIGPRPTIVERDSNMPPLDVLLLEARRAARLNAAVEVP
ncbi:multinuclear nonheme iron-dependent oxidase, partial [Streptomyces galilaeus]|uniref:multinuclear nonheme iron-dependent oxidase n=1 Tax=Streptomyces galilaeus TaxID=33899 RepID=UPI0038F687DD